MNLSYLFTFLIGNSNSSKDVLTRKPTREDYIRNLNCWIERNFYIIALAAIIILLILFILVCFAIVGVSATDSGVTYNHMNTII